MVRVLNQYPQLLSLSSLAPINQVAKLAKEAAAKANCNCKVGPIYAAHRATFEYALTMLGHGDHLIAKNVLNVDQICYYTKNSAGKFELKCV